MSISASTASPRTIPPFSKIAWIDAVYRDKTLTPTQRLAIIGLGLTADREGNEAWRSNARIAADIGVSKRTVESAIPAGVAAGYLKVTRKARGMANHYQLGVPSPVEQASATTETPCGAPPKLVAVATESDCGRVPKPTAVPTETGCGRVPKQVADSEGSSLGLTLGREAAPESTDPAAPAATVAPCPEIPPTPTCDRHPGGTAAPCGACGQARRLYEAWNLRRARELADRHESERRAQLAAKWAAIDACDMCDDNGMCRGLWHGVCDHRTDRYEYRPGSGPEMLRQILAAKSSGQGSALVAVLAA
ncbi:MAG: hypothetical protein J2P17_36125 [Mycobacterium sp.]|nr:hypothetical protein [Mycobacterium sp.]